MSQNDTKKRRGDLVDENLALITAVDKEQRTLTTDEQSKYDANMDEINNLDALDDLSERRAKIHSLKEGLKAAPAKTGPIAVGKQTDSNLQTSAFRGWLKSWHSQQNERIKLTVEERQAMDALGVQAGRTNFVLRNNAYQLSSFPEQRALAEGVWSLSGGSSPLFSYYNVGDLIDTALKAYGSLMNVGKVIETPTGFVLPLAQINDTANSAAIIGENAPLTPVDLGAQANLNFNAYKLSTAIVFSQEILSDTAGEGFPLESYLSDLLGTRMSRGAEAYMATGSGSGQPQGITVGATNSSIVLGGTTASPLWTGDNLIDLLEGSIDPLYMQQPKFSIMAHQKTVVQWRKIKTTTGEYIWSDGFGPATTGFDKKPVGYLRGVPVFLNNQFPQQGTQNNVLCVAGDMSKYVIRKVNQIEFFLNPYIYSLQGQIVLQCWMRFDAKVSNAGTAPLQSILNP